MEFSTLQIFFDPCFCRIIDHEDGSAYQKNIFRRAQVVIYIISYVKTAKESIAAFRLSKIDRIDGVFDSSNFCRSVYYKIFDLFLTKHRSRSWSRRSEKY